MASNSRRCRTCAPRDLEWGAGCDDNRAVGMPERGEMNEKAADRSDAANLSSADLDSDAPAPRDRASRVRAAIATWKAQLIDLGGRNTLLYYKDQKVGTLDLTNADPAAIDALLAGRSIRLATLFSDATRRLDAAKRARRIHAKAREHFEERGILTLYLGCGLATWASDRSSSTPSAPVLLRMAMLTPKGAAEDDFDLALSGEMEKIFAFLTTLWKVSTHLNSRKSHMRISPSSL